jgi:glycogen debranching enzyme
MDKEKIIFNLKKEIDQLKDPLGFLNAGYPYFYKLFGRDSLISSWQLLDYDSNIARSTLEILSQFQGIKIDDFSEEEPGKILHQHIIGESKHPKRNLPLPYYGSVDSTPLYLILFYFYFQKTQDKDFIEKYWQNIENAVNWMFDYGDKDKNLFLEYQRKNPNGLENQGWKDSNELKIKPPVEIVEVQGYQYFALIKIAELAEILNKDENFIQKLKERAKNLKEKFNQDFWLENKKYFALALDGDKKKIEWITSNPGHLLFTEIVDEDKIDFVVKKLFAEDLWTNYGIRTHSIFEENYDHISYHCGSVWPHDNWIIAQGLKKLGYLKEYEKIRSALFSAYKKLGFLPEYYAVIDDEIIIDNLKAKRPDYPQAWATGALINFLINE